MSLLLLMQWPVSLTVCKWVWSDSHRGCCLISAVWEKLRGIKNNDKWLAENEVSVWSHDL